MTGKIIRRDFLKKAALTGASITLLGRVPADGTTPDQNTFTSKGEHFTLAFHAKKGLFSILRNDGSMLLQNGTARFNLGGETRSLTSPSFKHRIRSSRITDQFGTGQMVRIMSEDTDRIIDTEIQIVLYDHPEVITIQTVLANLSQHDLMLSGLEPVCVIQEHGGRLFIPGVTRCITNGAVYYDAGRIHTFGTPFEKAVPYGETKGGRMKNSRLSETEETVHSWWNAGFFSGYDREGLVLGYVENNRSLGQLLITRIQPDQVLFTAESVYNPGYMLKPGQKIGSDRFAILMDRNPYKALESYASMAGAAGNARTHSIINGWCNWFYTYEHTSEEEIIRNAEFAAGNLKKYGLEYIQVDEGYQRWHGDWEGNERFPHGMKWLADRIKGYGLKAGIWVAPYVVSEPTELFQKNPEWFLRNEDGSLRRVGPWPGEDTDWARNENPKRYGLDITHPDAASWLHEMIDTMANRWGYEMIKIDFVAWSLLSAHHYFDASVTAAQAYRKGFEIMRKAAGEKCHFLDCGPGAVTIGLTDSMRIELDQNYGYSDDAWKQYFLNPSSSGPAAAKRYYFHKKTWINDADHICMNLLSVNQSQAAATLIALSGGNIMSGDRLTELDAGRLEILAKVLPAYGEAARPVDLFDSDLPSVFALKISKPFGEWTVAGFFNASLSEPVIRSFPLERLWLLPDQPYLVYDFWKQKFMGEITGDIQITVPPGSVTLLTFHAKSGVPQVISTSRHVLQGAIELEQVAWDAGTQTLNGISRGLPDSSHYVTVYLPDPEPWKQSGQGLFHDYGSYSLNRIENNIVRIWMHFRNEDQLAWQIKKDN